MERNFYSPVEGYKLCQDYDDGTDVFTLYTNSNGVGYIKKELKAEPHTTKYSTFATSFATTLWNLTTGVPRIGADGYYYWHSHPQSKTHN